MIEITLYDAYNMVSNNYKQTSLVQKLLDNWTYNTSMIQYKKKNDEDEEEYYYEDENEDDEVLLPDIYEWLVFPTFWDSDYEKLINAWIPILRTGEADWVWITSWWCHYDMFIYPELIKALFDMETDYYDIVEMRKNNP